MSKVSKGYMGEVIGKLGPAVGRQWKGKNVMSAYQKFPHNPGKASVTAYCGSGEVATI